MKYIFKIFVSLLLFLVTNKSGSQTDLSMSGYLFNLSSYTYTQQNRIYDIFEINESESITDLFRARFKPIFRISENSRFEAQYEINGMVSNRNMFILTEISENKRQLIKLAQNIHTDEHTVLNHYLDRFYFKQIFDFGEITAGRQRISWGVGRVWQPVDLFNPINPANFSKIEKDGADAISAKLYLGNFTDIELVYNPTMEKYSDNFGGRFRTNFYEYDVSVIAGNFDKRNIIGSEIAGNFFDAGLRGEILYSFKGGNYTKDFVKFIIGMDYQFTDKFYSLVEYQYNGEGISDKSKYDFLRLANAEILNVAQNYFAINSAYRLSDLTTLSAMANLNIDDGSFFSVLSTNYQYNQELQFNLSAMYTNGSQGSEFRFFPLALYIVTEYYF